MFESILQGNAVSVVGGILDLTIKAALVFSVAGIATSALRNRPASTRHAVWLAAVVGVLVLPVLTAVLPNWNVLPAQFAAESVMPAVPASQTVAGDEDATAWESEQPARPESSREAKSDGDASIRENPGAARVAPGLVAQVKNPVLRAVGDFWAQLMQLHWSVLMLGVWLVGFVVIMGNHVLGAIGLYLVSRRAQPIVSEDWLDLAEEIGDRLWITRDVQLLKSHVTTMPVTWGGRKPVVLLPSDADAWTDERRRYVLTHEFAHIRRWDVATQGIAQFACALYWFNPLVWMASRRLRIERERACDDQVIMTGGVASSYAEHLLDIARSLRATFASPLGAVAMARPSQLEGRVLAILDPERRRRNFGKVQTGVVAGLALAVILPIAAMAPQGSARISLASESVAAQESAVETTASEAPPASAKSVEATASTVSTTTVAAARGTTDVMSASMKPAVASRRPTVVLPDTIDTRRRQVADAFIKALGDEDEDMRRQAAQMLGEIGDERATPALKRTLQNEDSKDVRRAVLWALAEMDDDSVAPILIDLLGSETDSEARRQIAWMLGGNANEGDRRVGEALIGLLGDSDAEVRATAVWGLAEMEYTPALKALVGMTNDSSDDVSERAIWAIGELAEEAPNDEALAALTTALGSDNASVRQMAAWALGELEDPASVPVLTRTLADSNSEVRRSAARALAEIDTPESLRALMVAVDDEDVDIRRQAIYAIGELEDAGSVDVLIKAVGDSDPDIRRAAIIALVDIEDDRAAPVLVRALKDDDPDVRRMAAHGLSELEPTPTVVQGLRSALEDADPEVRRAVIYSLGELGDEASAEALVRALADDDSEVRRAAAHSLADILEDRDVPGAVKALSHMLETDSESDNRRAAAYALGELGSPEAIDVLRKAMEDSDREVRRAAANALSDIDWDDDDDDDEDNDSDNDSDWNNDNDRDNDSQASRNSNRNRNRNDIRITLDGSDLSAMTAVVGAAIGGITEMALFSAGSALESIDFDGIFHNIGHSLSAVDLDVDAMMDDVEVHLQGLDVEIEMEMRGALIEALVCAAEDNPGTSEYRAAIRALKRMDHPAAKRALRKFD